MLSHAGLITHRAGFCQCLTVLSYHIMQGQRWNQGKQGMKRGKIRIFLLSTGKNSSKKTIQDGKSSTCMPTCGLIRGLKHTLGYSLVALGESAVVSMLAELTWFSFSSSWYLRAFRSLSCACKLRCSWCSSLVLASIAACKLSLDHGLPDDSLQQSLSCICCLQRSPVAMPLPADTV